MITKRELETAQKRAFEMIRQAGVVIKEEEQQNIEVVDFGLSRLHTEGAQIWIVVNTERIAVKLLALFPNQTEPEHWHPAVGDDPGKEETVRVVAGTMLFYVPGEDTLNVGKIPDGKAEYYTVRHELIMQPGDQLTLQPGTKHWFQAGSDGAVMYSFSTCARDAKDGFSDPNIVRIVKVVEE